MDFMKVIFWIIIAFVGAILFALGMFFAISCMYVLFMYFTGPAIQKGTLTLASKFALYAIILIPFGKMVLKYGRYSLRKLERY